MYPDSVPNRWMRGRFYDDPSIPAVLVPSGDKSFEIDTLRINRSLIENRQTVLAAGDWYVRDIGVVTNDRVLRGVGAATVLNAASDAPAITLTGPGNVQISDLQIKGGTYGIVVNGAYDTQFEKLHITGQTLGGVKVNGDMATEQHWVDVVLRGVGGVGFAIERTTSIYTGSLYLDRVRLVEPAAGATAGFKFSSSAGSPSLNIAFMTQCVADNYAGDAYIANNCGQIFVSNCWFAINGSGPANSAAMKITNAFQHSYTGCYTYSGKNSPSVVLAGTQNGLTIDGHTFDGTPTTVALGVATATSTGFKLGSYSTYCGGGLADAGNRIPMDQPALPGTTLKHGEETFSRMLCNTSASMTAGTMLLSYFTSSKTELISTIEAMVADARTGGTYVGYGLFTVAANGDLTLVAKAEQTSSLTLWGSGFQPIGGFDTKLGLTATFSKVAGTRYAIGALQVGGTPPKLISNLQSNGTPASSLAVAGTALGELSAVKTGMTTLGAIGSTIAANTLAGSGFVPYFVLN